MQSTISNISEISKAHTKLEKDYKTSEAEREQLEEAVDKLRANIAQLEQTKKQLQHQVSLYDNFHLKTETAIVSGKSLLS